MTKSRCLARSPGLLAKVIMNYKGSESLLLWPLPDVLTKKVLERALAKERA